LLLNECL